MAFCVTTDKTLLDVDLIHRFLSEDSYWAKNIPRDRVVRSIEHSLCFGAFEAGQQIGFARVVTDFAVFAYIADVFVIPSHRGKGVSKMLMQAMLEHPELQGLRRWHLVTTDAHGLYRQYGFRELGHPEKHMEISVRDAYRAGPESFAE